MYYLVEIKETLSRVVAIEADSQLEAIEGAEELYREEKVTLDYEDSEGVEVDVLECRDGDVSDEPPTRCGSLYGKLKNGKDYMVS